MMENRKPGYSCRSLTRSKIFEEGPINGNDPSVSKSWKEVYNLVSIVENMKVYNKGLVDKYVKNINEKIYYLASQRRTDPSKRIRKPIKLIVSIDKSRINFKDLRTFNSIIENQVPVTLSSLENLDSGTPKQNAGLERPSFYFNHQDQNSFDVLLSVTEDIINSFSSSDSNFTMESQPVNKSSDFSLTQKETKRIEEEIIPHNPLAGNSEMACGSQKQGYNIFSQNEFYKKGIQEKYSDNRKEILEYRISGANSFPSDTEEAEETDCSCDTSVCSDKSNCEMWVDKDSNETIEGPIRRSERNATVYQFPATELRRSKRIQSAIAKKKISEKFFPHQKPRMKRFLRSKTSVRPGKVSTPRK